MRQRFVLVVLVLASSVLLRADPQLDRETGLWFPPFASRSAYLNRDPAHVYMRDVERAFNESPALAVEVCSAFLAAPEPRTSQINDPSVRQFRSMLAVACTGRTSQVRKKDEAASMMTAAMAQLQSIFDEEEHAVAALPEKRRDELSAQLVNVIDAGSGPSLRPALRMIALSPNYTFGIHSLMALPSGRLIDGSRGVSSAQLTTFLDRLYASRAADNRDDAFAWKAGLPAVLLFEGKLLEARKAANDWAAVAPRERASFARLMQSVTNRAAGQEGAFDRLAARCVPSRTWTESNPGTPAAEYCTKGAAMLLVNALDVQRDHASPGLVAAAYDLARLDSSELDVRVTLLRKAAEADPAGAQKQLYEILAQTNLPSGIQLDSVYSLMQIAAVHDPARVAPLVDCWLQLRETNIPPATADVWRHLATMPVHGPAPSAACASSSADSWCVMHVLAMRLKASIDIQQWTVARQTIEKMAAITAENQLDAAPIRTELADLAADEIRAGRRGKAVEILSYLKGQPADSYVAAELARLADTVPAGKSAPWHSPVALGPNDLVSDCPPHEGSVSRK